MTKSVIVRNPFTLNPDEHSLSSALKCEDASLTVQADAEAANINNIVAKFGVTGMLPYGNLQPVYDDFTEYPTDYHTALNLIRSADDAFMEMPAQIRSAFNNDPGSFLDALNDPTQHAKFVDLGLVPPKLPESPPGSDGAIDQPKGDSSGPAGPGTVNT